MHMSKSIIMIMYKIDLRSEKNNVISQALFYLVLVLTIFISEPDYLKQTRSMTVKTDQIHRLPL